LPQLSHAAAQRRSGKLGFEVFRCAVAPLREKAVANLLYTQPVIDQPEEFL